jgi:tRNA (Thr-GGU) A37 N-methylase
MRQELTVHSIGRVRGNTIHIHKRWAKGLQGIEDFSHIIVLFWLHKSRKPELRIHPKGLKELPRVSFLATRTPHRPNPVSMTVVKLLKRRGAE